MMLGPVSSSSGSELGIMNHTDDTRSARHEARDDVEFLASSWNRLEVLEAVSDAPRTRMELKERTDVSRVTLSRILSDLEERGWLVRDGNRFQATGAGTFVAAEVGRLLDNVVTAHELGEALELLPVDLFDFDVTRLRDATVITPGHDDLTAPTRDLVELAHRSDRFRGIPTGITREFIAALRDAAVSGELAVELLVPPPVFDIVTDDPELRRQFLDMADSGDADVLLHAADDPVVMIGIFDDHVMICGEGDRTVPSCTIQTTDDAVYSWAESHFDARRAGARRLEPGAFTQ